VAIETRKRVYARVGARIEDLLIKRDWLHAYRKDPRDTVGEILERSAPVRMPAQSQAEDRASL
jgi:hypothetical protein